MQIAGLDPREVYRAMLAREREMIPIDQEAAYLQYRSIIVDWMCEVAEEFKLNPYAVQLSVHYFDLALQQVKVKKSQLQLVAMCCTLLAGEGCAWVFFLTHLSKPLAISQPNFTDRRTECPASPISMRAQRTPTIVN